MGKLIIRRPARVIRGARLANVCKNLLYYGNEKAKVVIVVDPIVSSEKKQFKNPINAKQLSYIADRISGSGLKKDEILFLSACPPVTDRQWKSDKQMGEAIKAVHDEYVKVIEAIRPKIIVPMGKSAARAVFNRAVQITKVRGLPLEHETPIPGMPPYKCLVLPTLGVSHVMRQPEMEDIYRADMATFSSIVSKDYTLDYQEHVKHEYKWVNDIRFLLDNPPAEIAVDTETRGTRPFDPATRLLTVQICTGPGEAYCVPIDYNPFVKGEPGVIADDSKWTPNRPVSMLLRNKLKRQLKELLENPNVKVFGHNYKFDYRMLFHKLGIRTANYCDDTILLMHSIDENMRNKSLADCTRRFVPALSGYSDEFDKDPIHVEKTRMDLVPPGKMVKYGCGDTDATFRLRNALLPIAKKDAKNYKCYQLVTLPAMRSFCHVEDNGFYISTDELRKFGEMLREHQENERKRLEPMIPKEIRDKHKDTGVGFKLTRDVILRDMLFMHKKGLRLKPLVFTDSTKDNEDPATRVPSVSTKQHLPYFVGHPFVDGIIDYVKNEKLLTTYVGVEADENGAPTGFWQYIHEGQIRPSYLLHHTTTGRSNSRDPNGQNFPKRGKFAKQYLKIFKAPKGYVYVNVDFSQIELRIIAVLSRDPMMLKLYNEGADIHTATACYVNGLTLAQFGELPHDQRGLMRFQAKAVNFGFAIDGEAMVLTNEGEVPLKDVKPHQLVWDGVEWVKHKGVRFCGYQEVIEYAGIKATEDHEFFTQDGRKVPVGVAASTMDPKLIAATSSNGVPVRVPFSDGECGATGKEPEVYRNGMLRVSRGSMVIGGQHFVREDYELQMSASEEIRYRLPCKDAWSTVRCDGATVREGYARQLQELQDAWDKGSIQITRELHTVGLKEVAYGDVRGFGLRQKGQRRSLLSKEFASRDQIGELEKSKKIAVYDLIDAGPRHRFTINGKLVSNCYGMGWRKFRVYAKTEYGIDFTDQEAQNIRAAFFRLYRNLQRWHELTKEFAQEHGYVRALDGRVRHLPSVYSNDEAIVQAAYRNAVNSPVQGFGSDLGLMAIGRAPKELDPKLIQVCGFVHDAIVGLAPEERAIEAATALVNLMESNPLKEWFNLELPVPIIAEPAVGYNLSEMYELSDAVKKQPDFMQTAKTMNDVLRVLDPDKAARPRRLKLKRKANQQTSAKRKTPIKLRRAA